MVNRVVAFVALVFSLVCFYYAMVYARQGESYANHFMVGLGALGGATALAALLGK